MTAIEVSSYCLIILINTVIYYISFFFFLDYGMKLNWKCNCMSMQEIKYISLPGRLRFGYLQRMLGVC